MFAMGRSDNAGTTLAAAAMLIECGQWKSFVMQIERPRYIHNLRLDTCSEFEQTALGARWESKDQRECRVNEYETTQRLESHRSMDSCR